MPEFDRIGGHVVFDGQIFDVRRDQFRHADGKDVTREYVVHGGAVAVVAYDDEQVYLVRQPREAIERSDVLEIPAGRLDKEGEAPLETARRELAEELGKEADGWVHATTYYSSSGFTNEEVHVFLATGLRDVDPPDSGEDERIEIVTWPLEQLDGLLDACVDAKTLIGLFWLRRARELGGAPGQGA
jgi:8-oxo-dGTP pyrophosphatase MutT (NUDIX family)